MRKIDEVFVHEVCLSEILENRKDWLFNGNMKYADLRDVDLRGIDFTGVNLEKVYLTGADLRGVSLGNANLNDTNLEEVDLTGANLLCAKLIGANLACANLTYASLYRADLENVDLKGANLFGANLSDTNLKNIMTNHLTRFFYIQCPEEGSFIGYKRAHNCLIKLLILEDAKRSSATSKKCRCSKAKVLDIEDIETGEKIKKAYSNWERNFVYEVGKIVEVKDFCENRWRECAPGIHFFINKEDAITY